ncbi:PcfJ domain family protein [Bacillus phage vB_BanS-Thrax4]|nr:PcfJ domain family protein [Bacillus phage vB_BanS-Thrax4]
MTLSKYKIGITQNYNVEVDGETKKAYYTSCTCGKREIVGYDLDYQARQAIYNRECECGNNTFMHVEKNRRVAHPYLKVLDKSRKGFKIQRTNLSVMMDKDGNVKLKENMTRVILFDIPSNTLKVFKNGEPTHRYHVTQELKHFFTGISCTRVKSMVTVAETEYLYDFIWRRLSHSNSRNWNSNDKFYLGLERFIEGDYGYLQILSSAGFRNVDRFYATYNRWTTYHAIDKNGKSPREILKMPKFMMPYIRENSGFGLYNLEQVQKALKKIDGNKFRELVEIVKDESTIPDLCRTLDKLIEIHDTYNYNNLKKLTLYLFREIRMHQGIGNPETGATYLRDYIRMSEKLGLEYEKYPKSLKKEHDITQMNYKVQEDAKKKEEFLKAVSEENYQFLNYKKKMYSVIAPSEMDDLIREGNQLSHCVASYVTDVVADRCKILFLRNTDALDIPVATIEVRGGNVRQARGFANRSLTTSERAFVAEWAKVKELAVNYY